MRNLALLLTLFALLLCGCQADDSTDGIEFFTLHDDIWAPVTSSGAAEVPETEITTVAPTDDVTCNYVLNISSKSWNTIRPPSSAGNGSRFITPKLMLKKPTR